MPKRQWSLSVCLLVALSLNVGGRMVAQEAVVPPKPIKPAKPAFVPKITIGKDTTWATEPVGPDGIIDYLAVVNDKHSRGVTSENNAVVPLYQAMGPLPDGRRQPEEFYKLLGMAPPPDDGAYYEDVTQWWRRTHPDDVGRGIQLSNNAQIMAGSRPWTASDFPEISEWLQAIEQPLARVADATERPEYFSPFVSAPGANGKVIRVLLPGAQMARSLARALLARSMLHLGNKDRSRAWADLMTVHKLGRLVGRGPTVIEGLVGVALETMAIEAELKFISETRPNAKFVARYRKQIQDLPRHDPMVNKIDICERACFLDCCQQLARGRMQIAEITGNNDKDNLWTDQIFEGFLVQSINWDEVLKSGNRWYDRRVAAGKLPTQVERAKALTRLEEELKQLRHQPQGLAVVTIMADKTALTKFASDTLLSLLMSGVQQGVRGENRITQRTRNLELAFALSAWHGDHQSYPATLAELAPQYLKEVPTDLYNDQPLHYERTADGYRFYSVGDNGIDENGLTYGEKPGSDDLIVKMPVR